MNTIEVEFGQPGAGGEGGRRESLRRQRGRVGGTRKKGVVSRGCPLQKGVSAGRIRSSCPSNLLTTGSDTSPPTSRSMVSIPLPSNGLAQRHNAFKRDQPIPAHPRLAGEQDGRCGSCPNDQGGFPGISNFLIVALHPSLDKTSMAS